MAPADVAPTLSTPSWAGRATMRLSRWGRGRNSGSCNRIARTRRTRKRHPSLERLRHCRTDAAHALELGERAECTERIAIGDDAPGECRPDARQRLDLRGGGAVEIDRPSVGYGGLGRTFLRCRARRAGRADGQPRRQPAAGLGQRRACTPSARRDGSGGIDRLDLARQRALRDRIGGRRAARRPYPSHPRAERDDGSEEEQRLSLRGSGHGRRMRQHAGHAASSQCDDERSRSLAPQLTLPSTPPSDPLSPRGVRVHSWRARRQRSGISRSARRSMDR
jgi:hypothetical protein